MKEKKTEAAWQPGSRGQDELWDVMFLALGSE